MSGDFPQTIEGGVERFAASFVNRTISSHRIGGAENGGGAGSHANRGSVIDPEDFAAAGSNAEVSRQIREGRGGRR